MDNLVCTRPEADVAITGPTGSQASILLPINPSRAVCWREAGDRSPQSQQVYLHGTSHLSLHLLCPVHFWRAPQVQTPKYSCMQPVFTAFCSYRHHSVNSS